MNTKLIVELRTLANHYNDHKHNHLMALSYLRGLNKMLASGKLGLDTENCEVE